MKRFVLLAFALGGAAACGDNTDPGGDDDPIDAAVVDTQQPIDAPQEIDAAEGPRFTGTITFLETQILAPSPAPVNTVAAEGIQVGITFSDQTMAVQPVLDTQPGSLFGCKVTELTVAQVAGAAGIDEGTVSLTMNNGGDPPNLTFPACNFVPGGTGYICPDPSSSQALSATSIVTLTQINASTSRLTVTSGTATFNADDIGRYVKFSGTGNAAFDASHVAIPIVAPGSGPDNVIIGTPIPVAAIPLATGMMTVLAGAGPMPGLMDPGQLANGASTTFTLDASATSHYPDTTFTNGNVGDDFTMDAANAGRLRDLPRDGSAFSIACDDCGVAIGTVLNIVTTDAALPAGTSPFAMPTPATKRVTIRCAAAGIGQIDVPASVSAYIMNSGATRIQATFVRATFNSANPQNEGLGSAISGHAMVGFTTVPAP